MCTRTRRFKQVSLEEVLHAYENAVCKILKSKMSEDIGLVVGIGTGSLMFAQLIAYDLSLPVRYIDPKAKDYVSQVKRLRSERKKDGILVVDDIFDTGLTLKTFDLCMRKYNTKHKGKLYFATLFYRRKEFAVDALGESIPQYELPSKFVYGERISNTFYLKFPWERHYLGLVLRKSLEEAEDADN